MYTKKFIYKYSHLIIKLAQLVLNVRVPTYALILFGPLYPTVSTMTKQKFFCWAITLNGNASSMGCTDGRSPSELIIICDSIGPVNLFQSHFDARITQITEI